jgi:hypothetical protein
VVCLDSYPEIICNFTASLNVLCANNIEIYGQLQRGFQRHIH